MRRCLELASQSRGKVGNGALVGSVLVREGTVIAEGFYSGYGNLHSERDLLNKFDQEIRSNDVLYVNLEPCCHQGKTPPCSDILLEKGVKTIVFGMVDPDSRVSGKGIGILRSKGVNVLGPVLRAKCERFNRGFVSLRTRGRPWITLKKAQTRDGKIANPDGSPLKITSEEQDRWSHTFLRGESDAILVGVQTVIHDDPQLNKRLDQNKSMNSGINTYRIILDKSLKTPVDSKVVTDDDRNRTIIVTSQESLQTPQAQELQKRGVIVWSCPLNGDQFDLAVLVKDLGTPAGEFHGIGSILVEGGEKTWKAFKKAGLVDEEITLIGKM